MKQMKKAIAILLALLLTLTGMSFTTLSEEAPIDDVVAVVTEEPIPFPENASDEVTEPSTEIEDVKSPNTDTGAGNDELFTSPADGEESEADDPVADENADNDVNSDPGSDEPSDSPAGEEDGEPSTDGPIETIPSEPEEVDGENTSSADEDINFTVDGSLEGFDIDEIKRIIRESKGCKHNDLYIREIIDNETYKSLGPQEHEHTYRIISRELICQICWDTIQSVDIDKVVSGRSGHDWLYDHDNIFECSYCSETTTQAVSDTCEHHWTPEDWSGSNRFYCTKCAARKTVDYPCAHKQLYMAEDGNAYCPVCGKTVVFHPVQYYCKHRNFTVHKKGEKSTFYEELDSAVHLKRVDVHCYNDNNGIYRDAECDDCGTLLIVKKVGNNWKIDSVGVTDFCGWGEIESSTLEPHNFVGGKCVDCGAEREFSNEPNVTSGSFDRDAYTMTAGETLDVGVSASATNAELTRVVIRVDGYTEYDELVSKEISGMSWNGTLMLDGGTAPLNQPGTYTIKLIVGVDRGDPNWTEVDQAALVVTESTTFRITSPQKGQKVPADQPLTVRWTSAVGARYYSIYTKYELDSSENEAIMISGSENSYTLDASSIYYDKGSGAMLTICVNAYSSDGESLIDQALVTVKVVDRTAGISLSPKSAKLGVGQTLLLEPENAPSTPTYTSSNNKVATVSEDGLVIALKKGSATITAKTSNGKKATCKITVVNAPSSVKLNKTMLTLAVRQSEKLKATITSGSKATLTWESSDTNVATVAQDGTITAVGVGETTISVKTHNYTSGKPKLMATCKVTVKSAPTTLTIPEALTLGKGETYTLKPEIDEGSYGTFSFKSSDTKNVKVSKKGKLTALKIGTATIKVSVNGTLSKECTVTVVKAPSKVTLSAKKATINVGETFEFTATLPAGTASQFTTSSTKASVATITQTEPGKFTITALSKGKATITVKTFNGKTAKFNLTVK